MNDQPQRQQIEADEDDNSSSIAADDFVQLDQQHDGGNGPDGHGMNPIADRHRQLSSSSMDTIDLFADLKVLTH
jgi:hypothetical protein